MVDNAVQATWVAGQDGRIRHANRFALGALRDEQLVGRAIDETVHAHRPDGTPIALSETPLLEPLASGQTVAGDLDWFIRGDGTAARIAFVSVPADLPDGRGVVVAFTDVVEADDDELRDRAPPRQASLRRVATGVADAATSLRAFATIATEVGRMAGLPLLHVLRREPGDALTTLGAWSAHAQGFAAGARCPLAELPGGDELLRTRATTRVDDLSALPGAFAAALRAASIGTVVLTPVLLDGQVWGALLGGQRAGEPLPADVEERLASFGGLVATRVASMAGGRELARLADEQAALRRVATLVARDVPADELFSAVTREVGLLLGVDLANMNRYDNDGTAVPVASWSLRGDPVPLDLIAPDDGVNLASRVLRTGRVAERSDYHSGPSVIAAYLRPRGVTTRVGAPIVVDGAIWGVMIVAVTDDARLPSDLGARIADFSELVATAISNSETRAARQRLADDQSALRHIATLVAEDVGEETLLSEVTVTVGRLLGADLAAMTRYEGEEVMTMVTTWAADGAHPPVPARWRLTPEDLGDPGPIDRFMRDQAGVTSTVGCPIFVGGDLWGGLYLHGKGTRRLPDDTAHRLSNFTALIATAMANSQARTDLARLADEQTALRRVATLVAHQAPAEAVFAAVGEELGRLMWSSPTQVVRFEDDDNVTVLAGWGDAVTPANTVISIAGDNVCSLVRRSGRPVRISADQWSGRLGEYALSFGLQWGVGAPILVDGRVWGAMTVVTRDADGFPPDTEHRVARFADLIATAISNIEARTDLAASRARVVAAADEERKRVVRDLHDGAQQRLVHTVVTLKLALPLLEDGPGRELVAEGLVQSEQANDELRDLVHGILPGVLTDGGLQAAIASVASRMTIPVTVDAPARRLGQAVEATAYFVISEALTNVAKHAAATHVAITATVDEERGLLRVSVRDDGVGGARRGGRGLLGLADRLAAIDGRLQVDSPAGGGTTVEAVIPLAEPPA